LGDQFKNRMEETKRLIVTNPLMFAVSCDDIRIAPLAQFPYAVYYRLIGKVVVVAAVLHLARDPAIWQSRL